jgi:hypothetical protein
LSTRRRNLFHAARVAALALLAGGAASTASSLPLPAQDADAASLLAKAVEAFGGATAVDAVTALEIKGTGTRRIAAEDLPVTTVTRYYFPDRYYQELVLPMGTMKTVLGPQGAYIVAGEGALPLPDSERASIRKLMQRNVLAVLRSRGEPGFKAEAAGTDTVDGTPVRLLKISRQADTLTLAVDPATGQVRQTRFDSGGGLTPTGTLVITYSDYRPAGSLRYPFTAVAKMDGKPAFSQKVDSLVVNPKLDEALFQTPPPHAMFPGVEDLPKASPSPAPSPTKNPKE